MDYRGTSNDYVGPGNGVVVHDQRVYPYSAGARADIGLDTIDRRKAGGVKKECAEAHWPVEQQPRASSTSNGSANAGATLHS